MKTPLWNSVNRHLQNARRWYEETPERALDQAYDAALMIKAIEDEHFEGKRISNSSGQYSDNAFAFFQAELKKYLKIADIRLSEFKASRFIFNSTDGSASANSGAQGLRNKERSAIILEKLNFIDGVLDRYKSLPSSSLSLVPVSPYENSQALVNLDETASNGSRSRPPSEMSGQDSDGILDKTGVLPRSIVGTLNRIKRDLDPNSEEQVVQSFRSTKAKTLISIRFILLLIIVPLLTQQLSKAILIGPLVDYFRNPEKADIFINFELEEEALQELKTYEERLRFNQLLGRVAPEISEKKVERHSEGKPAGRSETESAEGKSTEGNPAGGKGEAAAVENPEASIEEKLREKVKELAKDYSTQSSNAIKNVFADLFALIGFTIVVMTNRREIAVLKSFIDETVYGLSDSAKAFIIILFTDMFVGFHSPHGWEVLLEGISRHLGLPANRDFIFLFIATFPVILDTIFKYWIFRYLNRISPSAVATYRNMNE